MTTAFVLSGGGALGAVQVGMLQALHDRGISPDLLVGSSVGALNAARVAADPSAEGLEHLATLWRSIRRRDAFPFPRAAALATLFGRRNHLVDASALRSLIAREIDYERLEDAPWPVSVVTTEVATGLEVVLSSGPAVDSVLASAALPGVLPAVSVEGHLLMDGGVVNNSPISTAVELGAQRVIVLPTGYACALASAPRSALGMALHAVTLAIQRRLIADVVAFREGVELLVVPPLCPLGVSPADFTQSPALIRRARDSTRHWLDAPLSSDQTAHLLLHRHGPRHPRPAHPIPTKATP